MFQLVRQQLLLLCRSTQHEEQFEDGESSIGEITEIAGQVGQLK